jgi:single-stranded-DNA-specific exonuclease
MKDIKKNLGKRDNGEDKPVIVIGNPKWRVGILGLVASKIVDEYKKPVFVWGAEGSDVIRGSCRGIGDMNLVSAMQALPEGSLLSYGGHMNAGGFSVSHEEVHFLEERLTSIWDNFDWSTVTDSDTSQMIDAVISLDDINIENFNTIEKLAPFGASNPRPVFKLPKVVIISAKEFGKDKNHLELIFSNSKNRPVKAISFFKTRESYPSRSVLKDGEVVDLLAMFEKSTFAGRTELRLRIVDII